jgi:hypothetical protein
MRFALMRFEMGFGVLTRATQERGDVALSQSKIAPIIALHFNSHSGPDRFGPPYFLHSKNHGLKGQVHNT